MNIKTTLRDPCPDCGATGRIDFVRRTQTVRAKWRLVSCQVEYFVCRSCGVEFTTPACADPLERLFAHRVPATRARANALLGAGAVGLRLRPHRTQPMRVAPLDRPRPLPSNTAHAKELS